MRGPDAAPKIIFARGQRLLLTRLDQPARKSQNLNFDRHNKRPGHKVLKVDYTSCTPSLKKGRRRFDFESLQERWRSRRDWVRHAEAAKKSGSSSKSSLLSSRVNYAGETWHHGLINIER
jgi:hypothetical protein